MLNHLIASEEIMAQYAKVFKLKIDSPPDGKKYYHVNNIFTVAAFYEPNISDADSKYQKMIDELKSMMMPPGYKLSVYESSTIANTPGCPWSLKQTLYNNGYIDADCIKVYNEHGITSVTSSSSTPKENTHFIISYASEVHSIARYFWTKFDQKSMVQKYEPSLLAVKEDYEKKLSNTHGSEEKDKITRSFQLEYEWMF